MSETTFATLRASFTGSTASLEAAYKKAQGIVASWAAADAAGSKKAETGTMSLAAAKRSLTLEYLKVSGATKAQVVAYEAEEGALRKLSATEKEQVAAMAGAIDAKKQVTAASRQAAAEQAAAAKQSAAAESQAAREAANAQKQQAREAAQAVKAAEREKVQAAREAEQQIAQAARATAMAERAASAETSRRWAAFGQGASRTRQIGSLMTLFVTLPILAAATASAKLSMEFEASMAKIQGLAGVPAEMVASWEPAILKLAQDTGRLPKELGDAMYFIASEGVTGKAAMDALTVSAQMARVGLGTTEETAKAVAFAVHDFAFQNLTAAQAGDTLTMAVTKGNVATDALVSSLGRVAPIAGILKIPFQQLAAEIAVLTRQGLSADEATTGIRQMFASLLKDAPQTAKALKSVHLSAGDLVQEMRTDLFGTLEKIAVAFHGNTAAMEKVFPNIRAFVGFLGTLNDKGATVRKVFDDMANSTGKLGSTVGTVAKTASDEWNRSMASLAVSAIGLGAALRPEFDSLNSVIQATTKWFNSLSDSDKVFVANTALVVAAIGPAVLLFGGLANAIVALRAFKVALTGSETAETAARIANTAAVTANTTALTGNATATAADAAAKRGLSLAEGGALTGAEDLGAGLSGLLVPIALGGAAVGILMYGVNALAESMDAQDRIADKVAKTTNQLHEEHVRAAQSTSDYSAKVLALVKSYEKLHDKINPTKKDLADTHTVLNQISQLAPGLISGFDSEGNAIGIVNGLLATMAHNASLAAAQMHALAIAQASANLAVAYSPASHFISDYQAGSYNPRSGMPSIGTLPKPSGGPSSIFGLPSPAHLPTSAYDRSQEAADVRVRSAAATAFNRHVQNMKDHLAAAEKGMGTIDPVTGMPYPVTKVSAQDAAFRHQQNQGNNSGNGGGGGGGKAKKGRESDADKAQDDFPQKLIEAQKAAAMSLPTWHNLDTSLESTSISYDIATGNLNGLTAAQERQILKLTLLAEHRKTAAKAADQQAAAEKTLKDAMAAPGGIGGVANLDERFKSMGKGYAPPTFTHGYGDEIGLGSSVVRNAIAQEVKATHKSLDDYAAIQLKIADAIARSNAKAGGTNARDEFIGSFVGEHADQMKGFTPDMVQNVRSGAGRQFDANQSNEFNQNFQKAIQSSSEELSKLTPATSAARVEMEMMRDGIQQMTVWQAIAVVSYQKQIKALQEWDDHVHEVSQAVTSTVMGILEKVEVEGSHHFQKNVVQGANSMARNMGNKAADQFIQGGITGLIKKIGHAPKVSALNPQQATMANTAAIQAMTSALIQFAQGLGINVQTAGGSAGAGGSFSGADGMMGPVASAMNGSPLGIFGVAQDAMKLAAGFMGHGAGGLGQNGAQDPNVPIGGWMNGGQGYAMGGDFFAGQPMLVGENGPEMMMPRSNGTVVPNHAMGGHTFNTSINVTGSADPARTAEQVERLTEKANRRSAARLG